MSIVDSLPRRALADGELAALNRSDAVDLAVAVESGGPTEGVLLATDRWVKGLALSGEGWRVVETVSLEGTERYDALRSCEDAVRAFADGE
ncbi:hypothetical protein [Halegenticoccus soli]|uniref:hypothetical protein n=1 Tax=Halegenticoccus soli TaxID=1985678 RepID=UPI000C6D5AB4|nr:hypothetical protein [Halegenticoccus soli]